MDIHAVGCAPEELSTVRMIDQGIIAKCYELCARWFGVEELQCLVRIIVVGGDFPLAKLPRKVGYLFQRRCRGCWIYELDAVFVRLYEDHIGSSMCETVFHELIHALIGLASRGYPYPCVVEEGMLCLAEAHLGVLLTERTWTPWGHVVSIRNLLRVDHRQFLGMSHMERLEFVALAEKVCEFLALWFKCKPGALGLLDRLRRLRPSRDKLAKGIARERLVTPRKLDEAFCFFLKKGALSEPCR